MKRFDTSGLTLTEAAAAFAALGSEQRLGIIEVLVRAGPEGLSMGELGDRSGIRGSTLTHHLKLLTAAGLVEQARQGRSIICTSVAYEQVEALSRFLLKNCCEDAAPSLIGKDHTHG
jgi:ArsR family transcriptional regulator